MPPAPDKTTISQGAQLKHDTLCTQCTTCTILDADTRGTGIPDHQPYHTPAQCDTFSLASSPLLQSTANARTKDPNTNPGVTCCQQAGLFPFIRAFFPSSLFSDAQGLHTAQSWSKAALPHLQLQAGAFCTALMPALMSQRTVQVVQELRGCIALITPVRTSPPYIALAPSKHSLCNQEGCPHATFSQHRPAFPAIPHQVPVQDFINKQENT